MAKAATSRYRRDAARDTAAAQQPLRITTVLSRVHWVRPELVAEVKYLYATDDHQLFQPVFVAIRQDKLAKACLRDQLVRTDRGVVM